MENRRYPSHFDFEKDLMGTLAVAYSGGGAVNPLTPPLENTKLKGNYV